MRQKQRVFSLFLLSPSSRRAWIEIPHEREVLQKARPSPSSRRAWIEIFAVPGEPKGKAVALLAEGVDRNRSDDTDDE